MDIVDLVQADLEERAKMGEKKYGMRLRAGNGRDALVDAYQEALDLVMYLRQAIEEKDAATRVQPPPKSTDNSDPTHLHLIKAESSQEEVIQEINKALEEAPGVAYAGMMSFVETGYNRVPLAPGGVIGFGCLPLLPYGALFRLGMSKWGLPGKSEARAEVGQDELWLFPAEWYDHIPNGFVVTDIMGRNRPFSQDFYDRDQRHGLLSYGILIPKRAKEKKHDA